MKKIFRARDYQPDATRDLDEELESHLELKVDDLIAQGMQEEEARGRARRELLAAQRSRGRRDAQAHTGSRLRRRGLAERGEALLRDLRQGFRRMARSPGFTLIAILSLAVGIGANTAVFSVVNGLFLRPSPYADPDGLVQVWTGMEGQRPSSDARWYEYEALLEVDGPFTGVAAFDGLFAGVQDEYGTRSEVVEAITPNLFPLLGIEPVLGRFFAPDEASNPAGDPLAILGHGYWVQNFDARPDVLGETVRISGIPHTILGVAPPEISALQTRTFNTGIFVPMSMSRFVSGRRADDGSILETPASVRIVARLAPGVSQEAAEGRISQVVREAREAQGQGVRDGWGFRLWPLDDQAIEPAIDAALAKVAAFIMVVAGLVLLLACTNLANLLLARGIGRRKELAMRVALGAGRRRLVGQLFTETAILAVLGGIAGFFLAQWAVDLLFRFQPDIGITFALETGPDVRVLFFTMAIVGFAAFFFGLLPALAATRSAIAPVIKGDAPGGKSGKMRLRGGLVGFQMAVSVILLTGSSLFLHSLERAKQTDLGFVPGGVVSVQVDLAPTGLRGADLTGRIDELRRAVASVAGLETVGVADMLPIGNRQTVGMTIPGHDVPEGGRRPWASQYRIDEGYLDALRIPLLSGRGIESADRADAEPVILVNQAFVARFWPGESALGKELVANGTSYRVVGVVGNTKVEFLGDPPEPTIYFSLHQWPSPEFYFLARGAMGEQELANQVRGALQAGDPDLLVLQIQSMEERVGIFLYPFRLATAYLGTFGLLALLLAAIGLYGVVSLSVSRRTREVGIRMSIGADRGKVVGMVLRGSLRPVIIGALVGMALAVGLGRLIESFLFGVRPADPVTLLAVPLMLGSVAILAAYVPARRASRVDPVEALKTE